jgi:hypothetical protein
MSLTNGKDIPPIFDNIIKQLKERKQIPVEEFRCMLFGLRIQKEDMDKIVKWFIKQGIIDRVTGGEEKKTRKDFVMFCFFNEK